MPIKSYFFHDVQGSVKYPCKFFVGVNGYAYATTEYSYLWELSRIQTKYHDEATFSCRDVGDCAECGE